MTNLLKSNVLIIMALGIFTSCGDMTSTIEEKINELSNKTEKLDSLVNKELDKVIALDSLIDKEGEKVKELDSLIHRSSSKLDSITNEKMNYLKKINN